jgi:hypothetical protein
MTRAIAFLLSNPLFPQKVIKDGQGLGDKTGNYWTIVHTIFFYARHHNSTLLALISPVITKI